MKYASKVDANQAEIVKALRQAGAFVVHTHTLKNAFDILVFYKGKTHIVEIKDGSKPPSKRKLTEGELKCKAGVESNGVNYNIVNNTKEALNLINGHS